MRILRRLLLLLIIASPCFAQNVRKDDVAWQKISQLTSLGTTVIIQPIPGANITIGKGASSCAVSTTSSGSIGSCSPLASLCSSETDTVCNQSNPTFADTNGNYGFWLPGSGVYQVAISGIGVSGKVVTYSVSCDPTSCVITTFISASSSPSQTGVIRLANTDAIGWRNNANNGDIDLFHIGAEGGNFPNDLFSFVTEPSGGISPFWGFPIIATSSLNVPATGSVRMGTLDSLTWRNNANSADVPLAKNTNDQLTFSGNLVTQSYVQTSTATNFGSNLGTQIVISSVPGSGSFEVFIAFDIDQTLAGSGCSAGSNTVTLTASYTAPGGTVINRASGTYTISANGSLDANLNGGPTGVNENFTAKSGTSITYTTTSSLGSSGCSPIPQYTIFAKVII